MNFSKYARQYTWLTTHPLWQGSMRQIAKQLPPSGPQLRLLDLSCGPAVTLAWLRDLRPDILPLGSDKAWGMIRLAIDSQKTGHYWQASAYHLPLPDNSLDAVLMQRTYYFLPHKPALLAEAQRVLRPGGRLILIDPRAGKFPLAAWRVARYGPRAMLDMMAWSAAARSIGSTTPQKIAAELEAAGYARILAEDTAAGWGVLARGEKPYPAQSSTLERVAVGAAESLHTASGRYIHLLIQQKPDKPAWKLADGEQIEWRAVAGQGADGIHVAMAFTSLPKAVNFMQEAILAGSGSDVNKVAKFSKEVAAGWAFPIHINPTLEEAQTAYQTFAPWFLLDTATAEAPDE